MNDMQEIIAGFAILSRYDDTAGGVILGQDCTLQAGPIGPDKVSPMDAQKLRILNWEFSTQSRRWMWY